MVWPLRLEPDAGPVVEPEPAPLRLLLRHFQPVPPPDALDALGVDHPAGRPEQRRDAAVAVTAILLGQRDDGGRQRRLVGAPTDVIDVLSDLFILRGVPGHVRSDNGPEFVAKAVREWITALGAKTAFIEPGSPWENGYCESFNSKLRDELLRPYVAKAPT